MSVTITSMRTSRATPRALQITATVYVAAWLVGLVIAPSGPGLGADAAAVQAHVEAHAGALMIQAGLVHGLAGIALVGFVLALTRGTRARHVRTAGIGAGTVSLVQLGVLVVAATSAAGSAANPDSISGLVHVVDLLDTAKLVLLAVTIAFATKGLRQPGWLRRLGVTLVVLLPVSGLAFVVGSAALYMLLYLSLPLLLLWVGSTAFAWSGSSAHPGFVRDQVGVEVDRGA